MSRITQRACGKISKKILQVLEYRGENNDRPSVQELYDRMKSGKESGDEPLSFWDIVPELKVKFKIKDVDAALKYLGVDVGKSLQALVIDKKKTQLQHASLNSANESKLFLGSEIQKGMILRQFKRGLFQFVYVNTKRYQGDLDTTVKRFSYGTSAFKDNIIRFKQSLVNTIVNNLNLFDLITEDDRQLAEMLGENPEYTIFQSALDPELIVNKYIRLMLDPRVLGFLSSKVLDGKIKYCGLEDMETLGALYILNNFDSLIATHLSGVLNTSSENSNMVTNMEYVVAEEGSQPNWWAAQSIESSNAELYASSVGKFILSTILKQDKYGNPIEGEYFSEKDVFNFSRLLRQAEAEYPHFFGTSKPTPSLKTDVAHAVKTLLSDLHTKQGSIVSKHWYEIKPIYDFLFGGTSEDHSIQEVINIELRNGNAKLIGNINDILGKLILELTISQSADYVEYTTTGLNGKGEATDQAARSFNDGLTTRTTGNIKDKIIFGLSDQIALDINDRNPYLCSNMALLLPSNISFAELRQMPNFDSINQAFKKLFGIDIDDRLLSESGYESNEGRNFTTNLGNLFRSISGIILSIDPSKPLEEQMADLQDVLNQSLFQDQRDEQGAIIATNPNKKFIANMAQVATDRKSPQPKTIIKNTSGKSIPINRLESTGMEKVYLMKHYKRGLSYRDLTNFFVANPHVLTKFINPTASDIVGEESDPVNENYGVDTGFVLETITNFGSNSASNSSGKEGAINALLGNFLSLGYEGKFAEQTFTFSDKSTKLLDMINTMSIIKGYGVSPNGDFVVKFNNGLGKALGDLDINELAGLFYYYRKNEMIDRVVHVLKTWTTLIPELEKDLVFPISKLNELVLTEIMFSTNDPQNIFLSLSQDGKVSVSEISNSGISVYDVIRDAWVKTKSRLKTVNGPEFSTWIENRIREVQRINPRFEVTIDLDYSDYKGLKTLNKNIWSHFDLIRSKQQFVRFQTQYALDLKNDPWFKLLEELVKGKDPKLGIAANLILNYLQEHDLWQAMDAQRSYVTGIPIELFLHKTLLDNFLRTQVLALHWKGAHLDKIKKTPDYDETSDESTLNVIIEEKKKFEAGGKRPVDLVGTKKAFLQGLLGGVTEEIKVSIIEEPKELVWDSLGQMEKLEILNGSARIHPIYARMESASLPGENFTGMNRKVLGSGIGDHRNTLFKYAEYPIDNFHIRESLHSKYRLYDLFLKMTGGLGDEEFDEDIDLTKNFTGRTLSIEDWNYGRKVFFAKGCYYYRIVGFKKVGVNTYDFDVRPVGENGEFLDFGQFNTRPLENYKGVKITNLFQLWEVLGGCESMQLGPDQKLDYAEDTMDMLYNFTVNVGSVAEGATEYNRTTVRLPLISKFKAMAASDSGIKRGIANLNSFKLAYLDNSKTLLYIYVKTACLGKQMDPTHEVEEDSDVTEMTQAISSLALNGYSMHDADRTYKAIAGIIIKKIQELVKGVGVFDQTQASALIERFSKELNKSIARDSTAGKARALAKAVEELLRMLPLSDRTFSRLFHKQIVLDINTRALRRKNPGMGAVLNPSSNTIQLFRFNGKDVLYTDLIKAARKFISDSGYVFSDMDTEEMIQLYIGSFYNPDLQGNSDVAKKLIETTQGTTEIFENILDEIKLRLDAFKSSNEVDATPELINAITNTCEKVKIHQVRDLQTFYLIQDSIDPNTGEVKLVITKRTFDDLPTIVELNRNFADSDVYIESLIPSDLKPEFVTFEVQTGVNPETGEPIYTLANHYRTIASYLGLLSYKINNDEVLDSGQTISEIEKSMIEEGNEMKEQCGN